ncbi:MAG: hypothetical protein NW223_06715 [Hyphomicrobiaceae bacterium]|nr:hypothetical protein [Hyphomicrobiaceae bacterium]
MDSYAVIFALFTGFSALRTVSYLPQILRIARDPNGASAISYATWIMWTGANISTSLYALCNLADAYLASISAVYACCCLAVIGLTFVKRRVSYASILAKAPAAMPTP